MTQGQMTYDLRRLRLHGLIERIPQTHRYRVTPLGLRIAMLYTRLYTRVLRPALTQTLAATSSDSRLARQFRTLETAIDRLAAEARLAA